MSMCLKMETSLSHDQIGTVLLQGHLFAQTQNVTVLGWSEGHGLDPIKGGL